MKGYGLTPMIGLALLLSTGCVDDTDAAEDDAVRTDDVVRVSMDELHQDVQSALDEFGSELERLDQRYSSATDDVAAAWVDTRSEMRDYRDGLEADLARLDGVSGDEARSLRQEMAEDLERLTARLEHARLDAIEDDWAFLSASRDRMVTLDDDLRALGTQAASLPEEAREEAADEVEEFRDEANELETRLDGLTDATAEEIAEGRDDIAEEIAALTASVRREMFEMRHVETD